VTQKHKKICAGKAQSVRPNRKPKMSNSSINKRGYVRIRHHWGAFVQPLLQWKSSKYYIVWVCVCSLRYPTWNSHAPYCHLWPLRLYCIFPLHLIKARFSKEKKMLLNIKCVFKFSLQILFKTFLVLSKTEWVLYRSSCKVPSILVGF